MIPKASLFPISADGDTNLFLVRDALRVRLIEDYNPGDNSILVEGDPETIGRFPPTGIITLTEQCSDIDLRAISFHYSSKTSTSFDGLEILPEFSGLDRAKPKRITNVTMNVVAMHHNHLKDSLVAVQGNLGTRYSGDRKTITGRIKYLESLAFRPKAWFTANIELGRAPLTVKFKNESFRLGPGSVTQTWDFGEGEPVEWTTSTPEEYSSYQGEFGGVAVDGTIVTKVYSEPGVYTVSLTVRNDYDEEGSTVTFQNLITAKTECPEEANISIIPRTTQSYTDGNINLGIPPKIRSLANNFIDLEVRQGKDPSRPLFSYAGELLKQGSSSSSGPVDPIVEYTWSLGDDLPHGNSPGARAAYGVGGLYDIVLRVDTSFGSYRITKYEGSIDVVESKNLWLFKFESPPSGGGGSVKAYEFGLNSETFKLLGNQTLTVDRNSGFLDEYQDPQYDSSTLERARNEFKRNIGFVPYGSLSSGRGGNSMIFWAKGGESVDSAEIASVKYNAFDDEYQAFSPITGRPWNWVSLNSPEKAYFLFGSNNQMLPGVNPSFAVRTDYDLATHSVSSETPLDSSSFENGSEELLEHPSYSPEGVPTNGYFATYRSAWKDSVGYILRNSSVNEFFRISNFYKTKGTLSSPFSAITKLPDMTGSVKTEGELVSMSNGIFFFNNSGEISAWNDTTLTWEVGRTGSTALTFRSVQDIGSSGFDERSNTLLAASDGDRVAYLSYEYSSKAFVKFNGTDLTFSVLKQRPSGDQFGMGVY